MSKSIFDLQGCRALLP